MLQGHGVIGLAKTYGHSRLEAACHRAMAHGSPYYRTVKTILSTNADQLPMPQTSTDAVYTKTRFVRDAASLFADLRIPSPLPFSPAERAAQAGFVTAMFGLGQLHEQGRLGRPDVALAHRWYLRAAEAGSIDAAVAVGTAFYLGRGVGHDPAAAAHWYRQAANGGDIGAQYLLASMYEQGDGVAQDLRLARYWYDIAARNGDEAAPGKVREIDARLKAGAPA